MAATTSTPTSAPAPASTTTAALDLLAAWCRLSLGEAKGDVLAAMGTPHGTAAADYGRQAGIDTGGLDVAEWDGVDGDLLVATFSGGQLVKAQAYDGPTPSPAGATNLSCPAFRVS